MNASLKTVAVVAILAALFMISSLPVHSSFPANLIVAQTPSDFSVFVPVVYSWDGKVPTSATLIEKAVTRGEISAEQGLIYKTFAAWGDARLPAQFHGSDDENAGDRVMREIAVQSATLSPTTWETLRPFFIPPTELESWWSLQHPAGASLDIQADTWQSVSAAGGKIKVWYFTGEADAARQAGVVQAELDRKIWNMETTLMSPKEPKAGTDIASVLNIYLWHSYLKIDGTVVPFDGTRGVAIAPQCNDTYSWIYINNTRLDGDENTPGIIQTVAHELFHSFQYAYKSQPCSAYDWLAEATAKWVEDHVYPNANSEWSYAPDYLKRPNVRLDDRTDNHEYGAYLLPYYLTHQANDPGIVRKMWENSELYTNSYLAVKNALPADQQDSFWGSFLLTLWNKVPYETFFQANDQFTGSVKPEWPNPLAITTPNHELVREMIGALPTGAARFYHFTFPDNSVRSLSFINGLTFNLRKDALWNSQFGSEYSDPADQTYASDPLYPYGDDKVVMFAMYKAAGKTGWEFLPLVSDVKSYCADTQGQVEDLIVVLSNGDFDNPDRVVAPQGLNTRLYANNLPCGQYIGTSRVTDFNAGITTTYSATNIVYKSLSSATISDLTFPYIYFDLESANVNWSISGTDSAGCTYSGSGSFTVGTHPGSGTDRIVLYSGVLPGGPSYRAYHAFGSPNDGETITYTQTCDGNSSQVLGYPTFFLEVAMDRDPQTLMIGNNGVLQGYFKLPGTGDDWTEYEWNLTPGP